MLRRLISVYIALMAVGFAFAALAAIRWPTIMLMVGILGEGASEAARSGLDWREIGILYGAPYFLASLCFYASASLVAQRKHGALTWYLMGVVSGFPCIYLVDFTPGWWRDPSAAEGAVAGIGAVAILLAIAVFDLRRRKARPVQPANASVQADTAAFIPDSRPRPSQPAPAMAYKRHGAFPAAAARNRARFAREGRKQRSHEEI